jgi:PAS domain S-box-containing protein
MQQKEEIQSQTDQLKSQSELLKLSNLELRQLSLVAKGTSNSVLILNEKGNIEWWNTGFTKLFKYKFKQYQGSNFNRIKTHIRPDLEKSIEEIMRTKETKVYTVKDKVSEDEYIWFQTTITPIFENDGSVFRFIVIDSDITQIKLAEHEIHYQKSQLEKQRDKIAHHNQEMTSSIEYASRIQQAMLPLPIFLDAILSDYFVLNLPRDIVSGDFYWTSRYNNKTYVAVGDCTGHGIPGAFLSLLGISFLNNIIQKNTDEYINPAEILNLLRDRLIVSLHQRGRNGEGQDGMDIALIMLDSNQMQMEFAGANNSIYFFTEDSEVQEIKGDKMPIGVHSNDNIPFTNNLQKLHNGDLFYLFTDGYRDQFGGQEGKKFMTKRFKKLLSTISDKDLNHQKQIIFEIFMEWKADYEQVDDILIFGIKV